MRSRLIKALNNRFYVKFMELEIGLLAGLMSPMCQYMILSLSQIVKIIGKYISLCNTFALSRIKFASATYLIAMVTGLPWQPE